MDFPFLRQTDIESAAEGLLSGALGPRPWRLPIDLDAIIFDHLAESEQLSFTDEIELGTQDGDQVLGMMLPAKGRIQVCKSVKERGPLGRYRFTVAHELGHWVLHRSLCLAADESLDLFESKESERGLVSLNRNVFPPAGGKVPPEEWQANSFAAMLLVPAAELASEFRRRFGSPPVTTDSEGPVANVAKDLAGRREGANDSLASTFGVSLQAMAIALQSRGYVTDEAVLI